MVAVNFSRPHLARQLKTVKINFASLDCLEVSRRQVNFDYYCFPLDSSIVHLVGPFQACSSWLLRGEAFLMEACPASMAFKPYRHNGASLA